MTNVMKLYIGPGHFTSVLTDVTDVFREHCDIDPISTRSVIPDFWPSGNRPIRIELLPSITSRVVDCSMFSGE